MPSVEPNSLAERRTRLASGEMQQVVREFVRRRVGQQDLDDVVQSVLLAALSAEELPADDSELKRWLIGVARHKVVDLYRRQGREQPSELLDNEHAPADRVEERELIEWADREARRASPDAARTLSWITREGEGEKLEHIAAEEKLPAAMVRQRVSRLRRAIKQRWLLELAGAAALTGVVFYVAYHYFFAPPAPPQALPDRPPLAPTQTAEADADHARRLRSSGLVLCDSLPEYCLKVLDEAKRIDPAGDEAEEIQRARRTARDALLRPLAPSAEPSSGFPDDSSSPYGSAFPLLSSEPSASKPPTREKDSKKEAPPAFEKKF